MTTRTATLLFTDIVDSTRAFTSVTEIEARRLRRTHFSHVGAAMESRGGTRIKTLGDGLMVRFEAARQAIEAGVATQLVLAGSRDLLAVRVGMSSGDVSLEDGDCFGLPVIEASRLCRRACPGQILVAESTRQLARGYAPIRKVEETQLKGLPSPTAIWEAVWSPKSKVPLRAVIADDAALVREGIARLLEDHGIEVLAQAGEPAQLLRLVDRLRPDLAIVDVRMPPTYTTEGIDAAEAIVARHPQVGVLILSQDVEHRYVERLRAARSHGVGYLLKERVADVRHFTEALRSVADGGTAFDSAFAATRVQS